MNKIESLIKGLETIKNYEGSAIDTHYGELLLGYEGIIDAMTIVDQNTMLSFGWHEFDGYWRIYI